MHSILTTILAFLPQFEGIAEPRTLMLPHTGKIKYYSSALQGGHGPVVDSDGTIQLARSTGGGGRLSRLWLKGGHVRSKLRMYFDGNATPFVNDRIGSAFDDGRAPMIPTWTFGPAACAGARVTYAPIRYRREATITMSSAPDAYEIELVEGETADVNIFPVDPRTEEFDIPQLEVAPGASGVFAEDDGSGTILWIAFEPASTETFDLANVRLQIFTDGESEPGIESSFARLFARPAASIKFSAGAIEASDSRMQFRLPIPYTKGCRIKIVNQGAKAIQIRGSAMVNRDPIPAAARRLRVRDWAGDASPGSPLVGHLSERAGHFVGMTATFGGPRELQLQGTFQFAADGEVVYRSHSIASAFDGGDEFGNAAFTTAGTGITQADAATRTAFCFRVGREIAFHRGFVVSMAAPPGKSFHAEGAVFLYEEPQAAQSRPVDAGTRK